MDAQALDFADASFDVVFCAFAFSSFPNRPQALHEFARVLRPGGRVCICDSFAWYFDQDPRWAWHRELLEQFSDLPDVADAPDASELESLLTSSELTNVVSKDEVYDLTFNDEGEWWLWSLSHGTRLLLDPIPGFRRDDFRSAAFTELRSLQTHEGAITAMMRATLTRADKPR